MASDSQKIVEFVLKLTGVDPKVLTPLISGFQDLDNIVKTTQTSIDSFQKTLVKLKPPTGLNTLAANLEKLNNIKLKDLSPLAANFQKLSKIEKLPNIGTFVNNIEKLSGTSFAGLTSLVRSFEALAKVNVEATVAKIRELNTALRALEKQGGLSTFARFATDVRAMRSALDNAQSSVNRITDSVHRIGNAAQKSGLQLRTFGDKIRTVLEFRLISEGIIQLKLAITNGVAAIIEYDQALKDLQAITGATNIEVGQMGAKILEVASTTKFSASEVAAGMRTIGQAGFSASEALQTMQAVSDLATGTLSDMSQTVDLVTTALRVFQIDASRASEVADVFANAVNRSKLTIEKLRTSLNYVGPIAQDANISFQELSAAMMTLANSGIRASTIGTSLRQVISALVSPSKKLKDAAYAAGVSLDELNPANSSLSDVLMNLNLVLKDTGTAFQVFGKRGASAALALTSANSQYNELLGIVSRTGTAAEQAAKQMEGLGVSFKNLRDKLGNLAIALGQAGIVQLMRLFVNVARDLVDILNVLVSTVTGRVLITFFVFTTAIAGVVGVLGILKALLMGPMFVGFISAVSAATASLIGFSAAAGLANIALGPLGIAILAITATSYYLFLSMQEGADDARIAAYDLATSYENLAKRVHDYRIETANLKEGSVELKEASLRLRKELDEVARSNSKLADKAREARDQIDPVTGAIYHQGRAIKELQKVADAFSTESLVIALKESNKELEKAIGLWDRWQARLLQGYGTNVAGPIKQLGQIIVGTLSGSFKEGLKDADTLGDTLKEVWKAGKEAFDFAKQLESGEKGFRDLKNEVAKYQTLTRPLALQEQRNKEAFENQEEAVQKLISSWRTAGDLELTDSIEHLENLGKIAKLSAGEMDALRVTYFDLQESTKKNYYSEPEKWSKRDEEQAKFLTQNITKYRELGGVINEVTEQKLKQYEEEQKRIGDKFIALEDEKRILKEQYRWNEEVSKKHHEKEEHLKKEAEESREKVALDKEAQRVIAFNKEVNDHKENLNRIRALYKSDTDLGKHLAQEEARHLKSAQNILFGLLDGDLDKQKETYTRHLKERESAHAAHINAIKRLEADKQITVEESSRRQQEAELSFYAISLQNAKNHLASMKEKDDPDEYNRRYNAVLEAEKKFYDEKAKNALASSSLLADLEKKEAEGRIKISEKIFKQILSNQKEATKTAEKELRADYEENILYLETYYRERRNLAEVNYREERDLLVKRGEDRQKELDMLISLSNSEIEIKDLKNKKVEEESDLLTVLNALYYQKRQLLADLNRQEVKDIETSRKRIDKTMESIAKNREQAEIDSKKLGLAETFNLGLIQIERRHQEEREEILRHARSVDEAELLMKEARAQQEREIDARTATHEREMFFLRLQMHEDFASNTSSIMQSIIASGLVQSKKMFKIGQAFAIAEATISAYNSAQKAKENIMNTYKNVPGAVVLANIAFAAEVAKGLATVAKIAAQQPPGYKEGGLIGGSSPHKKADNVNIRATAGEYMQPVDAVRYYGLRTMNAIRKLQIPREALSNFLVGSTAGLGRPTPSFALASGGSVPASSSNNDFTGLLNEIQNMGSNKQPINIINVTDPREISNYLASPEGTNALMNVISSRGEHLKRLLR